MKQQPTVLDIMRVTPSRYSFRLLRSDEPFIGATVQVWEVEVARDAILAMCNMVAQAVTAANCPTGKGDMALTPFEDAGKGLYNTLFPRFSYRVDELRSALRTLETPLLISTNDPEVLWELLHDGDPDGFFGLKYDLGRNLITRHVPFAPPTSKKGWRCLMIADPNENEPDWALPGAAVEAQALRSWLEQRDIHCDYLAGSQATFDEILKRLLQTSYDIIHYAGHVVLDDASHQYALRLKEGRLLTAGSLRTLVKPSPIVFLNACWAAQAKGLTNSLDSVQGLTDAFLEAGALAVLGSLFEAPDDGARAFAEKFYELILAGKTLGEAVRMARKHVMGRPEYAAAWACFVLYGNPCLRLEVKTDELERMLQGAATLRG